jgi:hypothetical protein
VIFVIVLYENLPARRRRRPRGTIPTLRAFRSIPALRPIRTIPAFRTLGAFPAIRGVGTLDPT